jgi:uncharacterized MAPEG superfamily protein
VTDRLDRRFASVTFPFWCLLVAALAPYVLAGLGGYFKYKQFGNVDNDHPRIQAAALEGAGARAVAAQQNAWEALALFTAAVVVAHLAGADPRLSSFASAIFLVTRVLHPIFYIANIATARSTVFMIGFGCCIWLFALAARA